MADQDSGDAAEEEWRFPLSEFEDDDSDPSGDGTGDPAAPGSGDGNGAATAADGTDDGVAAEPIEAGDPTLEGAFFVLLGAAFALFVVSRLFVG